MLPIGCIFFGIFYFISAAPQVPLYVTIGCLFLPLAWGNYHALMQVYGLLNQYRMDSGADARPAPIEKKIIQIFFCVTTFTRLFTFPIGLPAPLVTLIMRSQLVLLFFLLAVLFVVAARNIPAACTAERRLFLLRLAMYPLAPMSVAARFAIPANHGIEYLFVSEKMLNNTEHEQVRRKLWVTGALTLGLGTTMGVVAYLQFHHFFESLTNWYQLTTASLSAFAGMHYYLDGELFRMRSPVSRLEMAPLLRT
jgi:hypothetical protein